MENTNKRGVKRKRESISKTEDTLSKLSAKLHHGLKEVKKATKKAKAFEMQRVVKKLKDARKGEDEINIKNLEAQLECLKHIDLEDIAVRSLGSKIKKNALLSKDSDCQRAVSAELSTSGNEPSSDFPSRGLIESRMLSSKIVSSEVADVVKSLKHILGVDRQESPATYEVDEASDAEESVADEGKEAKTTTKKAPQVTQTSQADESTSDDKDKEQDESEEGNDEEAWAGLDNMDIEFERSDESEGLESSKFENVQMSVSDNVRSVTSHEPPPAKKIHSSRALAKEAAGKAGDSTFLPSLAVGFISGSSDSDFSDAEAKIADLPVKKNRRGQRARKAIWEKKYGKNAHHLRKKRENDVRVAVRTAYGQRGSRGRGTGMPLGGVVRGRGRPISDVGQGSSLHPKATQARHGRNQAAPPRPQDTPQPQGNVSGKSSNVHPRSNIHGEETKPLHPSWEAKRKLKEKETPVIVPFAGTRIKFT